MATLYEVNWHFVDEVFSHCTVTPITVLREGVLPGCTAVSITAMDASGRKFQGSPDNYFKTEEAAWRKIKADLLQTIKSNDEQVKALNAESYRIYLYLYSLPEQCDEKS